NTVRARRYARPADSVLNQLVADVVVVELGCVWRAQVPYPAIEALFFRNARLLILAGFRFLLFGDGFRLRIPTGEGANLLAVGLQKRQRNVGLWFSGDEVVDDDTVRWIARGVQVLVDLVASARILLLGVGDHHRARHAVILAAQRAMPEAAVDRE